MNTKNVVTLAVVVLLSGCAKLMPYLPSTTVADPHGQIEKIIMSNTGMGVTHVEFKPGYFTVASLSAYGAFQQSLRYELVRKIDILKTGGVHRVIVSDPEGNEIFIWGVTSVEDAYALADAIASEVATTPAPATAKQAAR